MLQQRLELPGDFLTSQQFSARLDEQGEQFVSWMTHLTLPCRSKSRIVARLDCQPRWGPTRTCRVEDSTASIRPSISTPATVTITGSSTRADPLTSRTALGCGSSSHSNCTVGGALHSSARERSDHCCRSRSDFPHAVFVHDDECEPELESSGTGAFVARRAAQYVSQNHVWRQKTGADNLAVKADGLTCANGLLCSGKDCLSTLGIHAETIHLFDVSGVVSVKHFP